MLSPPINPPAIGRWSLIAIRALSLIAMAVAGYLAWITLIHGTVAACGDEPSHMACDDVLRSPWSRWLGVPVSFYACLVYSSILMTSFFVAPNSDKRRRVMVQPLLVGLVSLAVGSALWFVFLQAFVIGKFCLFCMSIHSCGIIIGIVLLLPQIRRYVRDRLARQQKEQVAFLQRATVGQSPSVPSFPGGSRNSRRLVWPLASAAAALTLLVSGQIIFPAKTYEIHDADRVAEIESDVGSTEASSSSYTESDARGNVDTSLASNASGPSSSVPSLNGNIHESEPSSLKLSVGPHDSIPDADAPRNRRVSLLKGKLKIDIDQHGLLGSPDAETVVVELVDYTCKSCREVHNYMKQAQARYGDRLAVVVLPVPLETTCNPHIRSTAPEHIGACKYARLALGVLSIDRNAFGEFHNWLMRDESPPSIDDAIQKASELVDRVRLKTEVNGETVRQHLRSHMRVFAGTGVRRFPVMIVGDRIVSGTPSNAEELFNIIEQNSGITPLDVSR